MSSTPELLQTQRGWSLSVTLQLGRVSNLPTVWSNTVAAVVLTGSQRNIGVLALLLLSMSLAYIGGMFLNDAFDRHVDARERPERPIPSAQVKASDVFWVGYAMLCLSVLLLALAALPAGQLWVALLSGSALSACIIVYNCWHKNNPLSPLIMGSCRLLVYFCCALAVSGALNTPLLSGATVTLCYLIGLTFTAKQENLSQLENLWPLSFLLAPLFYGLFYAGTSPLLWLLNMCLLGWTLYCLHLIFRRSAGDIPRAVVRLIAGISLVDALLIAASLTARNAAPASVFMMVALCLLAFALTLLLQRFISGT